MVEHESKYTAFLRDENQLKQDWLCLLMADEHAPLDVCYKANLVKIEREFYPYAVCDLICDASWSATSYWTHKEYYTVPREEISYEDYTGKLHRRPGQDYDSRTGRYRSRRAFSHTVYDTEYNVIIDDVQDTSGSIGPEAVRKVIWTGPSEYEKTLKAWNERFNEDQLLHIDDISSLGIAIPEEATEDQVIETTKELASKTLNRLAKQQVPGNKHENFQLSEFRVVSAKITTCYISTYHVYYEYAGKEYDCIFTGGDNTSDVIINDRPIDEALKAHEDVLTKYTSKNSGCLYLLGAIVAGIVGLSLAWTGFLGSPSSPVKGIIGLLLVVAAVVCGFLYNRKSKVGDVFRNQKKQFTSGNADLRQRIYDLIQNDSIPDEEKGPIIKQWVNDYKSKAAANVAQAAADTNVCLNCGYKNAEYSTYCRKCGAKLREPSVHDADVKEEANGHAEPSQDAVLGDVVSCPKCGHLAKSGASFCTKCGSKLS